MFAGLALSAPSPHVSAQAAPTVTLTRMWCGTNAPTLSLVDMLAGLKLLTASVKYVGISPCHGDHTGQARLFPHAALLIGKGDWDALNDPKLAATPPRISRRGRVAAAKPSRWRPTRTCLETVP
jgi:glyoxylase-like metal-dependent hydrolase (beta-lactamase superfamily II)